MKRVSFLRTTAIVSGLLAVGWIALAACSNQGEGERCELGNFNDDCADGLICTAGVLLPVGFKTDRCCPPDRAQATAEGCLIGNTGPIGDATPSTETGPPARDAASEAADAADEAADAAEDG